MTPHDDPVSAAIVAFVRGEESSIALEEAGLTIGRDGDHLRVDEPPGVRVLTPTVHDVSAGLLANVASPQHLKEWAQLVLSANCIDLVELEINGNGEVLLGALWDAAEGVQPTDESLAVARDAASLS
jgi:hypothetical protein